MTYSQSTICRCQYIVLHVAVAYFENSRLMFDFVDVKRKGVLSNSVNDKAGDHPASISLPNVTVQIEETHSDDSDDDLSVF